MRAMIEPSSRISDFAIQWILYASQMPWCSLLLLNNRTQLVRFSATLRPKRYIGANPWLKYKDPRFSAAFWFGLVSKQKKRTLAHRLARHLHSTGGGIFAHPLLSIVWRAT
jgi:hypothetical protein